MKKAAFEAFDGVVTKLNKQYENFSVQWVQTELIKNYLGKQEFYHILNFLKKVREEKPDIDEVLANYSKELMKDESIDTRVFAQRMVEKLQASWKDQNPLVVVYFSPPYYLISIIDGTNPKDKALIDAVDNAVKLTKTIIN